MTTPTDTTTGAKVAPSITRRAMLGTLAAGAVALAGGVQAAPRMIATQGEGDSQEAAFLASLKPLSPGQVDQLAHVAEAIDQGTPQAWIKAARAVGLSVRQSRDEAIKGQALYLRPGVILYDPRQDAESVCRGIRECIESHLKAQAQPKRWSDEAIMEAIRSYRGEDPRLRAAAATLRTLEGTARPGELEDALAPLSEEEQTEALAIIAKGVK